MIFFMDLQPMRSDAIFTRPSSIVLCHDVESVKVVLCHQKRSGLKTKKAVILWVNVGIQFGSIIGLTFTNVVGSTSYCSSAQRYCQRLVRCSSNISLTNEMPTILYQSMRWVNVGPTRFNVINGLPFLRSLDISNSNIQCQTVSFIYIYIINALYV